MQHFQTSFFYDLRELIRTAPLMRKYYYIFKSLNLSALKDTNDRVGSTGYSRHVILRAFIVKHLDVTDDAHSRVPRDSKEFKDIFKDRQTVEQYFSRLGDREAEQTTHYGFTAISNQMTIAHLTASLIAVAAGIELKRPDKIRCYRTFAEPPGLCRTG